MNTSQTKPGKSPSLARARWLLSGASSIGRLKIDTSQYEELRLWAMQVELLLEKVSQMKHRASCEGEADYEKGCTCYLADRMQRAVSRRVLFRPKSRRGK